MVKTAKKKPKMIKLKSLYVLSMKVEVARMIQGVSVDVTINYNKLHADPKQGKSLDLVLKKVKVSYFLVLLILFSVTTCSIHTLDLPA